MVHDAGYLSRIEDLQWFPWTIDAVRLLNRAGFLVCVTSNQGGVGLGLFPESFVRDVHDHMAAMLAAGGATHRRMVLLSALSNGGRCRSSVATVTAANRSQE